MSARTIIIGDLHGCFDELIDLLDRVALSASDRVICVGDLIVKGEKNREVLDIFSSDERFSSVLGNHDRALLRFWNGETTSLKPTQARCRDELEPERARYHNYLRELPAMIKLDKYVVVHAGVRPGYALSDQSVEDLTELRTLGEDRTNREGVPWYELYDGEKTVLFGHWPMSPPRRGPRAIGLDTGCVYGYSLTAFILETSEFVSVPARRAYDQPANRI